YWITWWWFDREAVSWHSVATMATPFMTLLLQRAENRNNEALQAKLDELLRAHNEARKSLTRIDEAEPEDAKRASNAPFHLLLSHLGFAFRMRILGAFVGLA